MRKQKTTENTELTRVCPGCDVTFPREIFKSQGYCPDCKRLYNKKHRLLNEWGLSWQQYLEMSENGCDICGTHEPGKKGFVVDHCHESGKIRGLLCANCNRGIGLLGDDPALCESAASYLKKC